MLGHTGAVALNTFRETVRDRIFYLVALFGLVLVGTSAILSPLTLGAHGKIVADVGLAAMTLFGLAVVVLVGSNMVRKELEKRTITTILAKPVSRREYLLGKFCGLSLTLLCMFLLMAVVFLAAMFLTEATPHPRLLTAFYLGLLELLVINAAVVLFSTVCSPALAAMFTLSLFVIGHLSESIRSFSRLAGSSLQADIASVIYYLVPNLEVFNVRGAVVHGDPVGAGHVLLATLYGACFIGLFLTLATAAFRRKELR